MITNAPALGLTGWLTECHRQLLEANALVLTMLAAEGETGRKREDDVTRGAGPWRNVTWCRGQAQKQTFTP